MTDREEIIRLAQEAGAHVSSFHGRWVMYAETLERFADLVAAHEREACAKVCDELERANLYGVRECAAAIRARGEK